jgi:hypothetical protein
MMDVMESYACPNISIVGTALQNPSIILAFTPAVQRSYRFVACVGNDLERNQTARVSDKRDIGPGYASA